MKLKNRIAVLAVSACFTAGISGAAELSADWSGNLSAQIDAAAGVSDAVKAYVKSTLLPLCGNDVFAAEVAGQNAKGATPDEIKALDEEWINAEEELPMHGEKTGNACAVEIKKIVQSNPALVEVFVMDDQGANVGQNVLTSDYWQGDEAKFTAVYNQGKGGVWFGAVEYDKSANMEEQQVALPVIDASGKVIGAVCFGLVPSRI